jgi:hypothetical protein
MDKDSNDQHEKEKKKGKVHWTNDTKNNSSNSNSDDIYHKRQKTPVKHKNVNQEED